jgi:hypothetical protein
VISVAYHSYTNTNLFWHFKTDNPTPVQSNVSDLIINLHDNKSDIFLTGWFSGNCGTSKIVLTRGCITVKNKRRWECFVGSKRNIFTPVDNVFMNNVSLLRREIERPRESSRVYFNRGSSRVSFFCFGYRIRVTGKSGKEKNIWREVYPSQRTFPLSFCFFVITHRLIVDIYENRYLIIFSLSGCLIKSSNHSSN